MMCTIHNLYKKLLVEMEVDVVEDAAKMATFIAFTA